MKSFGTFLLTRLTLISEGGIVVCYAWNDGTILDNKAETGSNGFVTGRVDSEVSSETAGFDFGVNQIIIFLLNEKNCLSLIVKCSYPDS